jgi:effector-binding domain-containing protein
MSGIRVTQHTAQPTAGIRGSIPVEQVGAFVSRAFRVTAAALQAQGVTPAGPPFARYRGMPTSAVDIEAGFPVTRRIDPAGEVLPGELPGGQVIEAVHEGPYDSIRSTYDDVQRFAAESGLRPAEGMWECYLTDPQASPDPSTWRTMVCWPAEAAS